MVKKAVLIGTGGVGTVVALALEHAGKCEVTMVARSVYKLASSEGFEVDSVDYGKISNWKPNRITNSVEEAAKYGPYDYVVVSTKNIPELQKTEDVIAPLVVPGNSVVLIQNGIGGEEQLMEAFPESYIIGGISMIGSAIYNNKLSHTVGDHLILGTYDKREEAKKALQDFYDIYSVSKSRTELVTNLKYRRWVKLVYNSAFNTTAALTGLDTGRLMYSDLTYSTIMPAMLEVRKIAETELGEKLPEGIEKFMIVSDNGVHFEPSMLVDVKKGQPMEIEVILGNPLRIAKKLGVETPVLSMLYRLLHGVQFKLLEQRGVYTVPPSPFDPETVKPLFPLNL
ncbi:hypothetical protein DASB73_005340 [Starmerella bacillaris]|uniref:2-dehydropantoate 2-reductase n=1 Tax=Starmerella bacillaris TaxID=1247836 RepID=A0AAV5RDD1_STABA|nr:hypothetical protein DASB73_005340 [Starmerella bacillaris]